MAENPPAAVPSGQYESTGVPPDDGACARFDDVDVSVTPEEDWSDGLSLGEVPEPSREATRPLPGLIVDVDLRPFLSLDDVTAERCADVAGVIDWNGYAADTNACW